MNGVPRCASPECWEGRSPGSRFCQGHLDIFARVRAEITEDCERQNTWKKGVLRVAAVRKHRLRVAAGEILVDDIDPDESIAA
jgi:hypothetical protein